MYVSNFVYRVKACSPKNGIRWGGFEGRMDGEDVTPLSIEYCDLKGVLRLKPAWQEIKAVSDRMHSSVAFSSASSCFPCFSHGFSSRAYYLREFSRVESSKYYFLTARHEDTGTWLAEANANKSWFLMLVWRAVSYLPYLLGQCSELGNRSTDRRCHKHSNF
ncbi:hypothetical protein OPV22_009212 [Ensete ventricosum]|uniref:Uncharacterized protein n=1 Tax=Ensete ventricosum TaxID=4639 RepID=A0AAV8RAH5_ENSVE|nr:hypothetical protein OPV22_009212 [Ensete ventricosum]